ncbi:MAG: glycine--tRNA ligase subunit beta, partial [Mycobacteriaceae bacterium]|nr:glycine--tRNA ligase subunit beta [Mycobacteriaceae bacterium]
VFGQSESEMSRYYLDEADIDTTRTLLESYSREAARMIERELPVPAHVFVLKSSHAFNILDARGAISTAERASWFATMRGQSRAIAALWTQLREQAGHPRGVYQPPALATPPCDPATLTSAPGASLLLEIGTEELPPHVVDSAIEAVAAAVAQLLAGTSLPHGEFRVDATPRRIAVRIDDIAEREPDSTQIRRGPKVASAYDADGNPTPALNGFLKSQSAVLDDLVRIEFNGAEHVALQQAQHGRTAAVVLTDVCSQLATGLHADKNMRWNDPALTFSRPIRWLIALLDTAVLPVTAGTVTAGRTTRVDRQAAQPEIEIATAQQYPQALTDAGIVLDRNQRRSEVLRQARELAAAEGGRLGDDDALVDEITNLVESPVGVLGRFDPKYLALPQQILTTVMRKHQRYLPVLDADGALTSMFVTLANGVCDPAITRAGNENVLRARFADAEFFWNADLVVSLEEFRERLAGLTFAEKVGTMADRSNRIAAVATDLAGTITLSPAEATTLARAGQLAKFDLASQMVVELTSLAGTMAREYASAAGETPEVAAALWEMELPRHQGDSLPTSTAGALLALADRFDLLVAMLATGAKLTGTSDPYGLRRAGLGIVRILRAHPALEQITITAGLAAAAQRLREQGVPVDESATAAAEELIRTRFEQRLRDEDVDPVLIAAVRTTLTTPVRADRLIGHIRDGIDTGGQRFADLVEALQRIMRILPTDTPTGFDRDHLVDDAETALATVLDGIPAAVDLPDWIDTGYTLVEPLTRFFDDVLVMTDDHGLRKARLGLLNTALRRAPSDIDWRDVHLLRQRPQL